MQQPITAYIQQQLDALESGKLEKDAVSKGSLSFGIPQAQFGHLPGWHNMAKKKKQFKSNFWIGATFLSAVIVFVMSNIAAKMEVNFWKAFVSWILLSGVLLLFYVPLFFYNSYYSQHKVEIEARKLIYQNILQRLQDEAIKNKTA